MRLKRSYSCSSGLLQQLTLAEFLASGDYDRYLKTLRPVLQCNAERTSALVAQHFPSETRTSKPVGGAVLWIEMPGNVNSETLFGRGNKRRYQYRAGTDLFALHTLSEFHPAEFRAPVVRRD